MLTNWLKELQLEKTDSARLKHKKITYLLLKLKQMTIEMLLQPFISIINAELFKTVLLQM